MVDLLAPQPSDTVLEVGTGFGYQTAILSELVAQVWSVEIVEEFANHASLLLAQLGYLNVEVRAGDGVRGWAEHAPFDGIIVSAAASNCRRAARSANRRTNVRHCRRDDSS